MYVYVFARACVYFSSERVEGNEFRGGYSSERAEKEGENSDKAITVDLCPGRGGRQGLPNLTPCALSLRKLSAKLTIFSEVFFAFYFMRHRAIPIFIRP